MKRFLKLTGKIIAGLVLVISLIIVLSEVSPIYDFAPPKPFSGPDIFNPYAGVDSSVAWKRANFHTHTRIKGLLNECEYWPGEVREALEAFGYEIVTFSNHNKLTIDPAGPEFQVNVYEHGLNLFKYHKLVFGCEDIWRFDNILPFFASQRQFQIDRLAKKSDFIQLNHPFRTPFSTRPTMEKLSGYAITELDSGVTRGQEYWDWALSAGRYTFGLANDDLHYPNRSGRIAVRCNFLDCPSGRYEDLRDCLLSGRYYAMRVPDYGSGDWNVKYEMNRRLPRVKAIGVEENEIFLTLSARADSIKATGCGGRTLALVRGSDSLRYVLPIDEPYARLTAWFPDGAVIYTNPFARYDASATVSGDRIFPFERSLTHSVNWPLTILFNLIVLGLAAALGLAMVRLFRKSPNPGLMRK